MAEHFIEVGDSRPEYRLTRDDDSGDLKIEFLWSNGQQRSDKGCTEEEAKKIRDALIELYPIEDTQPVIEWTEYNVYPSSGRNEDGTYDVFEETFYSNGNGHSEVVARFWDKDKANEYAIKLDFNQILFNAEDEVFGNPCAEVKLPAEWRGGWPSGA